MKNQHPIKIFSYCSKNMWLLIFPLLRGLTAIKLMDFQSLYSWFEGAWFDILIVLFIFLTGFMRWKFSRFKAEDDRIVYQNGIFMRTIIDVPYSKVTSFTIENQFFLRFFKASVLYIDTSSGKFGENDLKITVSRKDAIMIQKNIEHYFAEFKKELLGNYHYKYKPKWFSMFFFSFIFSSTLTGVIYIAIFFIKSGKIVEEIIQERMIDKLSDVSRTVSEQVPLKISPLAITIALFFIGSWLISFIANIIRYTKFKIAVAGKIAEIHTGVLTKRNYYINTSKINYIDLRQSILTKIAKVMSINVNCSGYGNSRKEIPVFVPLMHKNHAVPALKAMLPDAPAFHRVDYKPSLRFLWRYTWKAVLLCVGFAVLYFAADYFFPVYHDAYIFVLIMAEIPSAWFGIVNIISNCTSGVSAYEGNICIKYSRGYVFHTVLARTDKIVKSVISQSIFQKFTKTCDISLYINSEFSLYHKVKSIKIADAEKIQNILTQV